MKPKQSTAQIADIIESINSSWCHGNIEELSPYFHDEIITLPPGETQPVTGKEALLRSFKEYCENTETISFNVTQMNIKVWDKTAAASFIFEVSYILNNTRHDEKGRDSWIFMQENEKWLAVWRTMAVF